MRDWFRVIGDRIDESYRSRVYGNLVTGSQQELVQKITFLSFSERPRYFTSGSLIASVLASSDFDLLLVQMVLKPRAGVLSMRYERPS